MSLLLAQFPEELIERILTHSIAADDRPAWLRSPAHRPDSRLAPLLVSKQLSRIAVPLFYHTIHLSSPATAHLLRRSLDSNPSLASHIRHLIVTGVWADVIHLMGLCGPSLRILDLSLTLEDEHEEHDSSSELAESLQALTGVQHITLRKPNNVYLSLPYPKHIIFSVARAISGWSDLVRTSLILPPNPH